MKIAVFGGTRGVGRSVIEQALAAGHSVRALARDPSALPASAELTVIRGDVRDIAPVKEAVTGVDAVVCSLGTRDSRSNPIESAGTRAILAAMKDKGVSRIVCVTSIGVGDTRGKEGFLFGKIIRPLFLTKVFEDKEIQEQLIRESGLDWVIIRPGGLTDAPARGAYRSGTDIKLGGGRIARADVASFALAQLTSDEYLRRTPAIIY